MKEKSTEKKRSYDLPLVEQKDKFETLVVDMRTHVMLHVHISMNSNSLKFVC